MFHDIVNELIGSMGHEFLRLLLSNIKRCEPSWYSIIADEQFNVFIWYVHDDYIVCEDSLV